MEERKLTEGITRLSIAHDLALTGSLQATELTNREQRSISVALEMLQEVITAHGVARTGPEPDRFPDMRAEELELFIAHMLVMRYGLKDLKFSALRENLPVAIVEQIDRIAQWDNPEDFHTSEGS